MYMRNRIFLPGRIRAGRLTTILMVLVVLIACLAAPYSYAEEEEETPAKPDNSSSINDLQNDLKDVRSDLDAAKTEYDKAVKEFKALEAQIAELEVKILEAEGEIESLQTQINDYSEQLLDLTQRIETLDREVSDQSSALNKRLRVMYMTGDQSMLSVLLGSENLIDLMSNLEMVRRIHESDKAFLADLEAKLDEVEKKKAEVEIIEAKLKTQQNALQVYKNLLDEDNAALEVAKARVKQIRDAAAAEVDRLEKESKRIEQELVNMTSQWGDYAGGAMAWPVIGPVTSEYGMRYHPITGRYTMHTGIDIGAKSGVPVHAAADVIVWSAGWNSGGYGNLIMLDNGSGIVTMYAHLSGFASSKGQVVHRGDIIGYVGSTGSSTGPHLHFEVRVNGAHQNPRGWLG